jgi:hypothetical protein
MPPAAAVAVIAVAAVRPWRGDVTAATAASPGDSVERRRMACGKERDVANERIEPDSAGLVYSS